MATAPGDELVFLPLGGVGEIGMNLAMYGYGGPTRRRWIVVDCGVTFGDPAETPGVDLILPDIRFAESERKNIAALVLTHAHEDHYGAVLDLWPRLKVPVIATPFTAALLAAKAAGEHGAPKVPVQIVQPGGRVSLPPFEIEFVPVAHSIPESHALAIRTPAGLVVHTGDWKLEPHPRPAEGFTDEARFRALGDEGVIAVVGDSTNAVRAGRSPSESEVAATLAELVRTAPQRVAVTTFASHIPRIRSVAEAAAECGREVVVVGRAMDRTVAVARETGWLNTATEFRSPDMFGYLPPDRTVLLLTGSQGEPRAALARIAAGDHPEIALSRGDRLIFSSRTIPGNERGVNRIVNAMIDKGVEVITDRTHLVHISGHPRLDEMADLYSWLRPRALVPVHGEALHLAEHEALGRRMSIPSVLRIGNGRMVRLAPGKPEVIDDVPAGRLYKDGRLLIAAGDSPVAERRKLAFSGFIAIALAVTEKGDLAGDPEIAMAGLPERDGRGTSFEAIIRDNVEETFENLPKSRRRDPDALAESIRRAVVGEMRNVWGKRPVCEVLVVEV